VEAVRIGIAVQDMDKQPIARMGVNYCAGHARVVNRLVDVGDDDLVPASGF
jgi:hypothetical protein